MDPTTVSESRDTSDYATQNDIIKLLTKLKRRSPTSKVLVGSTFGWVTGLFVIRVGKLVALSLGATIILLQIAQEKDFVKINWGKVDSSVKNVPNGLKEGTLQKLSKNISAAMNFDSVLSSGFLGGFLIGLSTD